MSIAFTQQYDDTIVMIVDALNLAFRYKHSGAKHFAEDYVRTIDSLRKSYKAGIVYIAADKGSSTFRKSVYPEYKQNRKDKYDAQSEVEKLEFEEFFEEFTVALDLLETKYPVLRFEGCEADDIAAYIVNKLKKHKTIWLMSSDKDWDLLIDDNVSRFSYVTRKEITKANWNEHYEYDCDSHISIKCITGDSGDNIPGVPGIGPKKAIELIKQYGTAYDICVSLPINSKYKHIANLNTFGSEGIMRNYLLMDLVSYCEDALGEDNCTSIDEVLDATT